MAKMEFANRALKTTELYIRNYVDKYTVVIYSFALHLFPIPILEQMFEDYFFYCLAGELGFLAGLA